MDNLFELDCLHIDLPDVFPVESENENIMLAENQLKYQGLMSSISQEFVNLQTVMK